MKRTSLKADLIEVAQLALRGAILDRQTNRMDYCGWDDVPELEKKTRAVLKRVKKSNTFLSLGSRPK